MNEIKKLVGLLPREEHWKFALLLAVLVLIAALEVTVLALLATYLSLLAGNPLNQIPFGGALLPLLPKSATQTDVIVTLSIVLLAAYGVRFVALTFGAYWQARVTYDAQADLAQRLVEIYFALPYEQFIRRNASEYTRNAVTSTNQLFAGVVTSSLGIVAESIVIVALMSAMFVVAPAVMAVVTVVAVGLGYFYLQAVRRPLSNFGHAQNVEAERLFAHMGNLFSGMKELKVAGIESAFVRGVRQTLKRYSHALRIGTFLNQIPRAILETCFVGSLAVVVLTMLLTGQSLHGAIPILTSFAAAGLRIAPGMSRIAGYAANLRFYWPSVSVLDEELTTLRDVASRKDVAERSEAKPLRWGRSDAIVFSHVSYSYPGALVPAVSDLSFSIPFGSRVAFIGPTGSGKSTVLDLILGLMTPTSGEILIGGQPAQSVLREWWSHISYVPQSIFLLDASVESNIAFDFSSKALDQLRFANAVKRAKLDQFLVDRKSSRKEERVGDSGIMLSGGERQRIGLARALYRGSDVIVLDEATSALDNENERQIVDALFALDRSKTLIFVAHRLSTVEQCDLIFQVREGQIAKQGTFESLGLPASVALAH